MHSSEGGEARLDNGAGKVADVGCARIVSNDDRSARGPPRRQVAAANLAAQGA